MRLLRYVLWVLGRLFLAMRYRIRVRGLRRLRGLRGALILPNHPGYIDPALLLTVLWPYLHPRPMMWEGSGDNSFFALLIKLTNAIPIPDMSRASKRARAQAEKALDSTAEALHRGENVLMWPAGRVYRSGREAIGAARAPSDILSRAPDAPVVLVRTRGVWGSSFSYAFTGKAPSLGKRLLGGIGWLMANLLFLMPRRKVDITLERIDRSQLPELTREKLNPWLEKWYNAPGPENATYVPYHFFLGPRHYDFPEPGGLSAADLSKIEPKTREEVNKILAAKLRRPLTAEEAQPQTGLDQLGLDSLDRMEVTLNVEQRFGFSGDEMPTTLGDLWLLAQGLAATGPPRPAPPEWFRPPSDDRPPEILGDTIAEAFVNRALASRKDVAAADDLAGVMTYERLLVGALLMARRFRKLPGDNVGLMLPASVGADIALLGLYLAGKLPVVLNWTTGPANLAHAARLMELKHVVTSSAFVDRTGIEVEDVESLFLEDVRRGIGKREMLRTLLSVRLFPGSIRGQVPRPNAEDPAVVLFTSGSERAPKAVPLTHRNLLSNQRAGITGFSLTRQDCALAFLPTFHSFGLSITTLLPLLSGIRVIHHPDPTDSGGLARKIDAYKATILVGTPTFVRYVLDRVGDSKGPQASRSGLPSRTEVPLGTRHLPGPLASLRLIVVGAEKCPPELVERCAQVVPDAKLIEGYGITECAPIISANRPDANRPGTLGQPLQGVEVRVVDLETEEPLPTGQMGMLWVSGPNVFPGYIGRDGPSPFRERDGKRWYVTGDLASVDEQGYIHFGGRLKRFLKAGGEMISLPALEEPLARRWEPTDEGPRVAVEGVETPGGRSIVLFTTEPISLEEANAILYQEGHRGVMRLDEVRQVKAIPVLGTGKTDYKVLRQWIESGDQQATVSDQQSAVSKEPVSSG
ncbi:MAG: AMP-binding protein [Gemmataceae bacterium]|nr:AMP-binding protein [Gemmataceae bacterium]